MAAPLISVAQNGPLILSTAMSTLVPAQHVMASQALRGSAQRMTLRNASYRRHIFVIVLFNAFQRVGKFICKAEVLTTDFHRSNTPNILDAHIRREPPQLLLDICITKVRAIIAAHSRPGCQLSLRLVRLETTLVHLIIDLTESSFLREEAVHVSRALIFLNLDSVQWRESAHSGVRLEDFVLFGAAAHIANTISS